MLSMSSMLCPAGESAEHREWQRTRMELEKQGVQVDHFAKTHAERERELFFIRQQLERLNDPAKGISMQSIGGGNARRPATPATTKGRPVKLQPAKNIRK